MSGIMKIKLRAAAPAAVVVAAVSACSSSGGMSGNVAGDSGTTAPSCDATVTPADNDSSDTVAALGTLDCASVVQFLGDQFPGYTVTPATSKGPGNAVCQGMLGGEYPATVTDSTGNSEDAECTFLEFSPAP
jgi:hypothetical protein